MIKHTHGGKMREASCHAIKFLLISIKLSSDWPGKAVQLSRIGNTRSRSGQESMGDGGICIKVCPYKDQALKCYLVT